MTVSTTISLLQLLYTSVHGHFRVSAQRPDAPTSPGPQKYGRLLGSQ